MRSEALPPVPGRSGTWLWWLAFWAFWTAFGLFLAAPSVLLPAGDQPVAWTRVLRITVLDMYSWAGVALVALWLPRVVSLSNGRRARSLLLLLAAGLLVLVARYFGAQGLVYALGWGRRLPQLDVFVQILPWNLLFFGGLLGLGYGVEYYRRMRDRELESARLELQASVLQTQLAQAQLQMLKMQLHPHFLFNTLNAISALVRRDPDGAERMISHLGDLLRTTLAQQRLHEVTLREEMEMLEPYLEIEKARFGERLQVDISLDPETLEARLPHLILQPLVENAIRHGVAPRQGQGRIEIQAARGNGSLRVWVRDNGRGLPERPADRPAGGGGGVGLANSRARLEHLYGEAASLRIGNRRDGGAEVELSIPIARGAPRPHDVHPAAIA